jgi:hypothetical protein
MRVYRILCVDRTSSLARLQHQASFFFFVFLFRDDDIEPNSSMNQLRLISG